MKHSRLSGLFFSILAAALFSHALSAVWVCARDSNIAPAAGLCQIQGRQWTYPLSAAGQTVVIVLAVALIAAAVWNIALQNKLRRRSRAKLKGLPEQNDAVGKELMLQREKAQMYLDIAAVVIVALDDMGNITLINKKGLSLLGLDEGQVVGQNWFDKFLPERVRPDVRAVFAGLIAGRTSSAEYFENPILCGDGTEKFIAWHNTVIRDDCGRIIGTLSSGLDITEQRRIQDRLRQSEHKFRTIFESSRDGLLLADAQTKRFLAANSNICTMLGCSAGEILSFGIEDIFLKEYLPRAMEYFDNLSGGALDAAIELPVLQKDGTVLYADITAASVQLDERPCLISAFRDATGRINANRLLGESRRTLATLIGNLPGVAYRCGVGPHRPMEFISNGCLEMTGRSSTEFLSGQISWNSVICPDDRQMVWDQIQSALSERKNYQIEYRIAAADGQEKWLWEKGCGIFRPDGQVIAIEGFINDITAREKNKQALQIFQFAVEHAAEAALWIGKDGRIIYANDAACKRFGYSKDDLLGSTIHGFDPDYPPHIWPLHWQELKEKGTLCFTSRHKRSDGVIVPVEVIANFVQYDGKEYNCSFSRDISGRKAAEAAREKLLRELQTKKEDLESIIYIASHDLKSPLVNIQGFAGELKKSCDRLAELLESDCPAKDEKAIEHIISNDIPESLSFIASGAAKMDSLLSGLLHLARIGKVSVSIRPVDMNRLVENLLRTFEHQMRRQQAHIEVADLPPCMGDTLFINQVFSNLVGNALKYCKPDVKVRIRIEGKVENNRAVFCVIDNGIGIDPQNSEQIFEIFHRLRSSESSAGQGLGLTIVRRILDRLDGTVRVQSEPGVGSTFFVELPAIDKPSSNG